MVRFCVLLIAKVCGPAKVVPPMVVTHCCAAGSSTESTTESLGTGQDGGKKNSVAS